MLGMAVACLGLVIVAHYHASISSLITKCEIDNTLLRMTQITASDYSIYFKLPADLFDYFKQNHSEKHESHLLAFKVMLES